MRQTLKERLAELIPIKQAEIKEVKQKYGAQSLGNVTVDMVFLFSS
jgi:citrate synthase